VDAYLEAFLNDLESHPEYSDNTRQAYAIDLRRFVDFLKNKLGRKPEIDDLSGQSISNYLESEKKTGYKPSTLYRRRSALRKFSDYLASKGITKFEFSFEKPFLKPRERRLVIEGKKVDYLSSGQIKRLFNVVSADQTPRSMRDLAILSVLFETGISIGALVALNIYDFNVRIGKLRVIISSGRQVWLNIPQSAQSIKEYLNLARPDLTQSPAEIALFVSQMGGRISRQGVWQMLGARGKKARIKRRLSARMIRHTATRRMLADGQPIEQIQKKLGHCNQISTRALLRRFKRRK
jgi:integrase/recombinase XerD